ncbi:MAG: methyl-accepting chemotaxis protein [Candidatus Omnitrophota bacterium]
MEGKKKNFVRKNYFILKGFQLRFSVLIFIATVVVSLIAVWTTYVVTWNEISLHVQTKQFSQKLKAHYSQEQGLGENIELVNAIFAVEFSGVFDKVAKALILRLLASSLILFVLSIFVSHKIAGPIYRMENVAKAIRDGDLTSDLSSLRAGDEFTELARLMNGALEKLRTAITKQKQMAERISVQAKKLSKATKKEEIEDLSKNVELIANTLVAEMETFKVKRKS